VLLQAEESFDIPLWYAIHTKPKQEKRACENLSAWGVETFAPLLRKRYIRPFVARPVYRDEPLFRSYIFARFDAGDMLHKVRFTRGVHGVVSCGGNPAPIDDEIIRLIQLRSEDGFVRLNDDLKHGDKVVVEGGPLKGLSGIFDRRTSDSERILLLLQTVTYQASVEVESALIRKAG
jgi:transcription elongation factor/antiterminator RfaH